MPGATADRRVYRTADGRLVGEGDPQAAFLAYPAGEPVTDSDGDAYRALIDDRPRVRPATKATPKPADKAAAKPADK
jgi:hypothetical protein